MIERWTRMGPGIEADRSREKQVDRASCDGRVSQRESKSRGNLVIRRFDEPRRPGHAD